MGDIDFANLKEKVAAVKAYSGSRPSSRGLRGGSRPRNVAAARTALRAVETLADAPEWDAGLGNRKRFAELTRADFGFPQPHNYFGGYTVSNDSPAGWVMRNLMSQKYPWGTMLRWGTPERATRAMDEAYARLQKELKQTATQKAADWRNTPAQINARYKLKLHKIRAAGIPNRFTRGRTRALQSGVLRANALARAGKSRETETGGWRLEVKHYGPGPHPDGSPQSVHGQRRGKQRDNANSALTNEQFWGMSLDEKKDFANKTPWRMDYAQYWSTANSLWTETSEGNSGHRMDDNPFVGPAIPKAYRSDIEKAIARGEVIAPAILEQFPNLKYRTLKKHGGAAHHQTGTPQAAHAGERAKSKWARVEEYPRVGRRVEDVVAVELGALFGMGENKTPAVPTSD